MSDAAKRTLQQQRIQQLQERLELYNASSTTRVDPSVGTSSASAASAAAAAASAPSNASKPLNTKPMRAAPPAVNSPDLKAPAAKTASSAASSSTAGAGTAESIFTTPQVPSTDGAATASAASQHAAPPVPTAAPRLARNLAQEFVKSASVSPASPPRPTGVGAEAASVFSTAPAAPAQASGSASAAAAAAATTATPGVPSPRRASDVFRFHDGFSDEEEHGEGEEDAAASGDSEYMEYEVEEMEEYGEESDEEGEFSNEEEEPVVHSHAEPPTLDNVLRRIFRAYSGSPERPEFTTSQAPQQHQQQESDAAAAGASHESYIPRFVNTSAERAYRAAESNLAAAAAASASDSAGTRTSHPLIQRAAELYRQHRLHQQQQLQRRRAEPQQPQQQHHSPFGTTAGLDGRGHDFTSDDDDDENSSLTSTSLSESGHDARPPHAHPHVDSNGNELESATATTSSATSTVSSEGYVSPATAYAALQTGGGILGSRLAGAGGSAASVTRATPSPSPSPSPLLQAQCPAAAAGEASASPAAPVPLSATSSFDQLETAYRQLLLLQRGVEYAEERTGIPHFPQPLPHQEKAHTLAQQRDALVQRDAEMRAAPPAGASLEDVRKTEVVALETTLADIRMKLDAALATLKAVTERGSVVESKRRLLNQRETDLAKQREARLIVEKEISAVEQRLGERAEKLKKREADYNVSLQQHDEQQKSAQEHIGEVEHLSKQVSSWLAILEERDRRLAGKEKRLQRVQADLMRRAEDVRVWKRATQRVKQIPPPPSPPRIQL